MNCCNGESAETAIAPHLSRPWLRRAAAAIEWAIPITTLALIPKCPMCVAAYVLLLTGVGVSFTAAAAIRWSLIALCVCALAFLVLRAARRAGARIGG